MMLHLFKLKNCEHVSVTALLTLQELLLGGKVKQNPKSYGKFSKENSKF